MTTIKTFAISIAMLALTLTSLSVANEDESKLSIDTLLSLKRISDVQISPDGKWVAYSVRRIDEEKDKHFTQIMMSSIDGKDTFALTASHLNASSPRFSPNGKSIGFIGVRGDGEAKSQVWLLDRRGGEAQQYTNVEQGVSGFEWSPNGELMLLAIRDAEDSEKDSEEDNGKKSKAKDSPKPYVIDRLQFKRDYAGYLDRKRTHYYVFDGSNEPVQITSGDYEDSEAVWSPDSTKIAFTSKRDGDPDTNDNSDVYVVSADPKAKEHPLTQITQNKGRDFAPQWSPDGKHIAYITSVEPNKLWYDMTMVAEMKADGKDSPKLLTESLDREIYSLQYAPNGKSIYITTPKNGTLPLIEVSRKSGKRKVLTPKDVSVNSFSADKDGSLVVLASNHYQPAEIYTLKRSKMKAVSSVNKATIESLKLSKVERLKVAGWNGEEVESFVYYPNDYDSSTKYPVIFHLHGGPVAQHDSSFDYWGQLYAANGYIAVLPNPHGSTGYGEAFTYALNRQWGVPDVADVNAIADHLVSKGIVDENKMGVGGWSYGGILTNYVITNTTRFAGAVTGASVVNTRANYGHDHYQHYWEVEMGLPWEDIEAWEAINMFNDIGKITTPTLVMGGAVDWNVPIQNSEQLYQGLKRLGVDTQLVVYPNEHHGISRPSFIRDRFERYLAWFDRTVKKIDSTEK